MTDGLKDVHREAIIAAIAANDRVERAVLFGSRATETNTVTSDVDIALFGDRLTLTDQARLAAALDELPMAQRVDLLLYKTIDNPALREQIERHGVEWYRRSPASAGFDTAGEWATVTIAEIAERVAMGPFGSSIKVETFVPDGIPIISGKHLHGTRVNDEVDYNFITAEHAAKLKNANVQRGDVVFTHAGNIGQSAYVPQNSKYNRYVISQRQFYLRPDATKVLPEFVVAFFKTTEGRHKLLANSSQVGVPSIARPVTYLRTIELSLPPLSEQRAIAHILGVLDDKIEVNRRMNATLEAMARAIFKDWFVDFGPTRARMEGRKPYLAPEIWNLFPDALADDGKPEGWRVAKMEDYLELAYGKSLPAKQRLPGTVTVYGSGGIAGTHNASLVDGPVVIVGRKGTVGSLYWEDRPAFPIDTVFYVAPRVGSMLFNYHLLGVQPLSDMNTDAAVPGLNRGNVYRLKVPLIPESLLSAFDRIAQPLWKRRSASLRESRTLAQTRDLLLPKLMSGKIRLTGTENSSRRRHE